MQEQLGHQLRLPNGEQQRVSTAQRVGREGGRALDS